MDYCVRLITVNHCAGQLYLGSCWAAAWMGQWAQTDNSPGHLTACWPLPPLLTLALVRRRGGGGWLCSVQCTPLLQTTVSMDLKLLTTFLVGTANWRVHRTGNYSVQDSELDSVHVVCTRWVSEHAPSDSVQKSFIALCSTSTDRVRTTFPSVLRIKYRPKKCNCRLICPRFVQYGSI